MLDVIAEGRLVTADEIAEAVGVTGRTVKTIVSRLMEMGLEKEQGAKGPVDGSKCDVRSGATSL